jgi:hypothetical protein
MADQFGLNPSALGSDIGLGSAGACAAAGRPIEIVKASASVGVNCSVGVVGSRTSGARCLRPVTRKSRHIPVTRLRRLSATACLSFYDDRLAENG